MATLGDYVIATGPANILDAPKNGGATQVSQAKVNTILGTATGPEITNRGATFVEFTPLSGPSTVKHYVDKDSVRLAAAPSASVSIVKGQILMASDTVNVLDGPYNGGAKVLYSVESDGVLGVCTGNVYRDQGSAYAQFTELSGPQGSQYGRISYVDMDGIYGREPMPGEIEEDPATTVTTTTPTGDKVDTTTSSTGAVVIAQTDKKTGTVAVKSGTTQNPPSITPKWLTYALYALIGLSLIGAGVIVFRLFSPKKQAATPSRK